MAAKWIELVTGSLEEKRRYRQFKERAGQLPPNYRTTILALERYFMYFGGISDGALLVRMVEDLADLFEQAVADETPIRALVGEDPVEFAETFLANYSQGQWINKERQRLIADIAGAVAADEAEGRRP